MPDDVLTQLMDMSHSLGDPAHDLAILGEGNTSARIDDETFYIKSSGTELRTMQPDHFVKVRFATLLDLVGRTDVTDEVVKETFAAASVDADWQRPSTEALMHAILLSLPDVNFVGHTHPTVINWFTCANRGWEAWQGRLFPDEIVCCGLAPVWVPYADPGIPLARKVKAELEAFIDREGLRPKVIMMQNHGLVALGATPAEVTNATMMMCKTARILWGTFAVGGPHYLTESNVERIFTRPDEKYRMALLERGEKQGRNE